MPIPFACPCGKSYALPEAFAGRRTQCKTCGVAFTVPPAPVAADDFEVLDEPPPKPKPKAIKAAVVEDDEPPRKRRKKPKYAGMTRDEQREMADELAAVEARRLRVIRSTAFVAFGGVILIGDAVLLIFRGDFAAVAQGPPVLLYLFMGLAAVMGVAAVGKGTWSLLTGQLES